MHSLLCFSALLPPDFEPIGRSSCGCKNAPSDATTLLEVLNAILMLLMGLMTMVITININNNNDNSDYSCILAGLGLLTTFVFFRQQ